MEKGWIQPSTSQYTHPLVFIKKKETTPQICNNCRALNANTIIDAYPIPHIDNIIDFLGESVIISKIDLAEGYHQI